MALRNSNVFVFGQSPVPPGAALAVWARFISIGTLIAGIAACVSPSKWLMVLLFASVLLVPLALLYISWLRRLRIVARSEKISIHLEGYLGAARTLQLGQDTSVCLFVTQPFWCLRITSGGTVVVQTDQLPDNGLPKLCNDAARALGWKSTSAVFAKSVVRHERVVALAFTVIFLISSLLFAAAEVAFGPMRTASLGSAFLVVLYVELYLARVTGKSIG